MHHTQQGPAFSRPCVAWGRQPRPVRLAKPTLSLSPKLMHKRQLLEFRVGKENGILKRHSHVPGSTRPSEAQGSSQGTSAEGRLRRVVRDTLVRVPAHTNACSHPPRLPRDDCPTPIRSQRPPARRSRHRPSGTASGGGGGASPGPPASLLLPRRPAPRGRASLAGAARTYPARTQGSATR